MLLNKRRILWGSNVGHEILLSTSPTVGSLVYRVHVLCAISTGLCGTSGPGVSYRSNTDRVTLSYHQGLAILDQRKAFNVTFTYFKVGEESTWE